ncbi:MAG: glycosyltransferase family 2 protein [bacterium]|nr:glycosyltransferase family 2 protein [bacterium]
MLQESISVILPAFNEEENIERSVKMSLETMSRYFREVEIIPVNDGSADSTGSLIDLSAKKDPRVRPVHHPVNKGYGAALRSGFEAATGELVFFTDADNQFDLDEITLLIDKLNEADMVIGYRIRRSDHFMRTVNASLYKMLIRILFGLKVRDIDCAFKLFRRSLLEGLRLESDGALISAELLIKAMMSGCSMIQVGVHHFPRLAGEQTGANLKVILKAFIEIFKFYGKLKHSPITRRSAKCAAGEKG